MAQHTSHHKSEKTANRRQVVFITALVLIALLFVGRVIALLTQRLRPSADVTTQTQVNTSDVVVRDGVVTYDTQDNKKGTVGVNQVDLDRLSSELAFKFSVQGRSDLTNAPTFTGRVVVTRADNTTVSTTWVATVAQTLESKAERRVVITDVAFKNYLTSNPGPFTVDMKVDRYLTKRITINSAANWLGQTLDFGLAPAGDFNNDNVVNVADLAMINFYLEDATNDENAIFDLNGSGRIGGDDLAIMNANLERTTN